jgi:hypothetical protein
MQCEAGYATQAIQVRRREARRARRARQAIQGDQFNPVNTGQSNWGVRGEARRGDAMQCDAMRCNARRYEASDLKQAIRGRRATRGGRCRAQCERSEVGDSRWARQSVRGGPFEVGETRRATRLYEARQPRRCDAFVYMRAQAGRVAPCHLSNSCSNHSISTHTSSTTSNCVQYYHQHLTSNFDCSIAIRSAVINATVQTTLANYYRFEQLSISSSSSSTSSGCGMQQYLQQGRRHVPTYRDQQLID